MVRFASVVVEVFGPQYLREPTIADIKRITALSEARGLPVCFTDHKLPTLLKKLKQNSYRDTKTRSGSCGCGSYKWRRPEEAKQENLHSQQLCWATARSTRVGAPASAVGGECSSHRRSAPEELSGRSRRPPRRRPSSVSQACFFCFFVCTPQPLVRRSELGQAVDRVGRGDRWWPASTGAGNGSDGGGGGTSAVVESARGGAGWVWRRRQLGLGSETARDWCNVVDKPKAYVCVLGTLSLTNIFLHHLQAPSLQLRCGRGTHQISL
ncbi:uncharacterized protein LOC123405788 [Hordeum vulgare subsp. vulgare]|uniref:uncharacterized protein LOC123405788 n=1 Tax=Hordeum vulgare subsp. vulgare TaxID=112509 RepID=UPI001D1A33CF|nr:uncharacterized protein LOC123405788 [Hordeum vulgare subsp. vulgare]